MEPRSPQKNRSEGGKRAGAGRPPVDRQPLISVITAVRNGEHCLEKTIASVLEQDFANREYIIIDGASTDQTKKIIEKYESKIDYWISEPDRGISDAFNKGISIASGRWINFLNAGDVYADRSTLSGMSLHFSRASIVTAFVRHGAITIPSYCHENSEPLPVKAMISHQGSFIDKDVFSDVGAFSTNFSIRMDYEFWLRALKKYTFYFVDNTIIHYHAGLSSGNVRVFYQEEIKANRLHGVPAVYSVKACCKLLIKKYMLFHP